MRTAMAVGFSCLFLGMSLVDISVMSFVLQNEKIDGARMLLAREYAYFKSSQPVISTLFMLIGLVLPFMVLKLLYADVWPLIACKRDGFTRLQHACGAFVLAGVAAIVSTVLLYIKPAEQAVQVYGRVQDIAHLRALYCVPPLINVCMIVANVVKHGCGEVVAERVAAKVAAVGSGRASHGGGGGHSKPSAADSDPKAKNA